MEFFQMCFCRSDAIYHNLYWGIFIQNWLSRWSAQLCAHARAACGTCWNGLSEWRNTGVWKQHSLWALAMESCGRNCSPALDLVCFKLIVPKACFSEGVFFYRHRYVKEREYLFIVRRMREVLLLLLLLLLLLRLRLLLLRPKKKEQKEGRAPGKTGRAASSAAATGGRARGRPGGGLIKNRNSWGG